MGILDVASYRSVVRGFNYFNEDCVITLKRLADYQFDADVKGSHNKIYRIHLDADHPRKSNCNCPHANGRRVVCKHIVATFFSSFPSEAQAYQQKIDAEIEDYEEREDLWINDLKEQVNNMSEQEVRQAYLTSLIEQREMAHLYGLEEEFDDF
ncbi:SWIM zinc finger family protein [Staphylococcus simiae]|uniref:SWIM zinc finger family protein n=1 Tax=Staphylococcus simiae TaxID=308354 RepID=UPI001A96F61E|nr:SWIM zinc finger family protein [Staphylococcus simiae]MBO1197785.1 SWIM zinc finger family protein [Staphylococcus simiae]MBO1200553.1 SWIM zinc finger family protein [Staphylococcus simiae]MBO1202825.1 SWIM zinc finger family protein [Staphylococcus simiae]MBO1211409.1 SWIM zinc finger family protein [Staphylococcus simiae]MBO1229784.1 SWIM zinc finger family protein [Staphylococcus simiae]